MLLQLVVQLLFLIKVRDVVLKAVHFLAVRTDVLLVAWWADARPLLIGRPLVIQKLLLFVHDYWIEVFLVCDTAIIRVRVSATLLVKGIKLDT